MLNRRILRVKAMQALYGFYTTRESLKNVIRGHLEQKYTPDPLIHDLSDTAELDANRILALKAYDENLESGKLKNSEDLNEEVFNAVRDAIKSYYDQVNTEGKRIHKSMLQAAQDIQLEYFRFLMLASEFQFIEKQDKDRLDSANIQKASSWKHHLIDNPIIESISTNKDLNKEITKHKLSWEGDVDTLRSWYKNILKNDERFIEYEELGSPNLQDQFGIIKYFFKNLLFKNETISEFFEERNLNWSEDSHVLKSMLTKTIQDLDLEGMSIDLKTISINKAEDFDFFETIYKATIKLGTDSTCLPLQRIIIQIKLFLLTQIIYFGFNLQ